MMALQGPTPPLLRRGTIGSRAATAVSQQPLRTPRLEVPGAKCRTCVAHDVAQKGHVMRRSMRNELLRICNLPSGVNAVPS